MRTITVEPGTEIIGATVQSLVQNMAASEYRPLLSKYGFANIDPGTWYPLQDFVDFLKELTLHPHLMFSLVAIGMSIAEVAPMPPELMNAPFSKVVEGWNEHYQASARYGDVGRKVTIQVGKRHYKVVHEQTIMPDELEYGVLYGFAQRFLPETSVFDVWFDENELPMDEGGERTVIHVRWD